MSITKKVIGYTPDKEAVTSYLLERKGVQVELLNYGAVIRSIRVPDRNGIVKDVVLGFDNLEDYFVNVPSFGAAIGRIVGPVPDLRLQVGDDVVMLEPSNEEGVHIHGGKKGFSHALWQAREKESVNGAAVQMNYVSPEGEDGYPGMICAGISYELDDEGNLKVIYTGESDRATPFNPTNHSYFNLAGHDSGTIKNHIVQLRHTCVMVNPCRRRIHRLIYGIPNVSGRLWIPENRRWQEDMIIFMGWKERGYGKSCMRGNRKAGVRYRYPLTLRGQFFIQEITYLTIRGKKERFMGKARVLPVSLVLWKQKNHLTPLMFGC